MKRNLILKASGIAVAMALGALAAPTMAQDYPSSTIDTPSQTGPSYESQQPSDSYMNSEIIDGRSWGNMPRTQPRAVEPRGARGPLRSNDDMRYKMSREQEGSRLDRTKSYFRQPVGDRGYVGFLNWRESNTDTP